ncbi:MAG: glycosyltransferase family 4 protein [Caulobacteraceae bacterium]|nr:glycosyltransferase family 4 protein [Caulobacteraceae bacterium]
MKVLLISQYFWPEEFRINDLAVELKARGLDVTVLTGVPNYPGGEVFSEYRARPGDHAAFQGVPIVRVPLIPRKAGRGRDLILNYLSFALSASTLGLWRLRRERFDVVFVFLGSPAFQALPAAVLKLLRGTPNLLWIQDPWPDTLQAMGAVRSRAALNLVGAAVNWLYRRSWGLLIQSESYRADVSRRGGSGVRVEYFPNWADPSLAAGLEGAVPAPETSGFTDGFTVMFAGNLGEAQDLGAVVEAAALCRDLPDVRWLLVGEGKARMALQAQVAELGLQDRVIFLGRHPSTRMPEFFAAADVLLVSLADQPIFAMTVPSKLQSYMAAGKPILGMLNGEGARVLTESGAGRACPAGDAGGLARLVRQMREAGATDLAAMGAAGRSYARTHFDKDVLIDRLTDWMRQATGRQALPMDQ